MLLTQDSGACQVNGGGMRAVPAPPKVPAEGAKQAGAGKSEIADAGDRHKLFPRGTGASTSCLWTISLGSPCMPIWGKARIRTIQSGSSEAFPTSTAFVNWIPLIKKALARVSFYTPLIGLIGQPYEGS